ncbi:hypothetical protein EMIT0P294_100178 [Pseudomonas sp. IT-P294]
MLDSLEIRKVVGVEIIFETGADIRASAVDVDRAALVLEVVEVHQAEIHAEAGLIGVVGDRAVQVRTRENQHLASVAGNAHFGRGVDVFQRHRVHADFLLEVVLGLVPLVADPVVEAPLAGGVLHRHVEVAGVDHHGLVGANGVHRHPGVDLAIDAAVPRVAMRFVGIADTGVQVVIVGHHANARHVEDVFARIDADLVDKRQDQVLGALAVGELAFEARHQDHEFFHRHQRVQRLVISLAVESGGDAFLSERTQLFGRAQLGVQEDVAGVDGFFEVSFLLKLIDVQIHDSTPECIESLKSRPHVSKLKSNQAGGGSIKAKSAESSTKCIVGTKKIPVGTGLPAPTGRCVD